MKRLFFVVFLFVLCWHSRIDALDWKALHEQADAGSMDDALSASRKSPNSIEKSYVLALVYLNNHKDREAEQVFRDILKIEPGLAEAKWGLAEVFRRQKKSKESHRLLSEIIKTNPGFSPAYITLAYLKYREGKFQETVKLVLKVRKQGREQVDLSNYTRSYLVYAGAKGMIASKAGPLSKLINGTQVLPNLKKAEKLQPASQAVMFGLGSFYFLAPAIAGGSQEKALRYLKKAVEIDPLFVDAYVRIAQVYKTRGEAQTYRYYMKKAFDIDPENELYKDETAGICLFNCVTVKE